MRKDKITVLDDSTNNGFREVAGTCNGKSFEYFYNIIDHSIQFSDSLTDSEKASIKKRLFNQEVE